MRARSFPNNKQLNTSEQSFYCLSSFTLILSIMLASCFVLGPVEDAVDEAATTVVLVVAVSGAEVTTFEATVLVAVFDEAVEAADVTTCCCCCWVAAGGGGGGGVDVATGPAVDGGVAVVIVEF